MIGILILGQGFIGTYLADLLRNRDFSFAATTTDGRNNTIKWRLPSSSSDVADYALPSANTIIVTFPLQGSAAATQLIEGYLGYHDNKIRPQWIYLGSTRPFKEIPSTRFTKPDIIAGGPRVEAEELIISKYKGKVLNLAGLWGGERVPEKWSRFYTEKEKLRQKLSARGLHLVHGADVARAILAVITVPESGRWLVSDGSTYDMLQILLRDERVRGLLEELMHEAEVRRMLGADKVEDVRLGESEVTLRIDPSHFWAAVAIQPEYPYVIGEPDPFTGF
ncbi:hypothetical protein GGF37_002805 [Kickxella alabastrina]|nr:hypothetical protein GGF37_002805 [Kickxella alabastrina]